MSNLMLAQNSWLKGEILSQEDNSPVLGAMIYWEGTNNAVVSDDNGRFEIEKDSSSSVLIIDFIGFATKKLKIQGEEEIVVLLTQDNTLESVNIVIEKPTTRIDFYSTIKLEELSEKALEKAACCNLSESFETNPTVDVSFTDAVTGTKQIQLLGLSGPYSLITSGNIPTLGLNSTVTGLDFIPGQWLSSIQLVKGTGSVVNGNQSIAGQINAEYKEVNPDEKLFLNIYGNSGSKSEINIIKGIPINKNLNTGLFLQADNGFIPMDNNSDGFMDNQLGPKLVAMNTWKFDSDSSNWEIQSGMKFNYTDKEGGQIPEFENPYLFKNKQNRAEAWSKTGYIFNSPGRSIGLQMLAVNDEKNLDFGNRKLNANEQMFYANLIYSDIIKNTNHVVKTGINYQFTQLNNQFESNQYGWKNNSAGFFGEYTWKPIHKFSLVSGVRYDFSSLWKNVLTPRIHGRWELNENSVFRFSGGLGTKNPNPFMENIGVFASSRKINLTNNLQQEQAWNYGINYTQKGKFKNAPFTLSIDLYRTDFKNKLITNYDFNSKEIWFYNLENGAYANSIMGQFIIEPTRSLEITLAHGFYDVQSKFDRANFSRNPLSPAHRTFANSEWKISDKWTWDATISWIGKSRIPSTADNEPEWQLDDWSDDFWLVNSQIKFTPNKKWDIYLGAENLLNYKQPQPILDTDNPFGDNFDASLIWAPVFGRMVYSGVKVNFN